MKLLYFHIPKTAGSSINQFFATHIPKHHFHIESQKNLDKAFCESYDFISGHVTYTKMDRIINLEEWITFATFRDPLSYTISHLKWVRKLADSGEKKRLKGHSQIIQDIALKMKKFDFSIPKEITKFIQWLESINVFYFHNTQLHYIHPTQNQDFISDRQLEIALQKMKKINFIGIQEDLDEFMEIISYEFGWKLDSIPKVNINENNYGFDINDPETQEALLPLYEKDLIIYEEAKKLYNKQKILYETKEIENIVGSVDKITPKEVKGWARSKTSLKKLELELQINEKVIQKTKANLFRQGLKNKGIHPTGMCAFSFDLDNKININDVVVKVVDSDTIITKHIPDKPKETTLQLIEPNKKTDLDTSKTRKSTGVIGKVDETQVIGWGKYVHSNEAADVELYINDKLVQTKLAKDFRQHLLDAKIHPTGHCGYFFNLENSPLRYGDKVAVKLADDIHFLKNSNQIFKKKFKCCIVHIGMHKTGSSSIQHNLNKKQNKNFSYFNLEAENHSIPIYSLFSEVPENYHIHKRRGLTKSQVNNYNVKVDKMFRRHLLNNNQYDTFVISGEDIASLPKKSLENFKNYLLNFFETIKIVAYVRSPMSYINSHVQQVIKGGSVEFSNINRISPRYKDRFEKFDLLFGKENVFLSYFDKDHLIDKDVTIDFIKRNNLEVDKKNFTKTNESLSLEAVSLLYTYNKFGPKQIANTKSAKEYLMLINTLKKFGSKKFRLSKKLLLSTIDKQKEDIKWMEDRIAMQLFDDKHYVEGNNSIQCEEDLFEAAKLSINELKRTIGEANITKEIEGVTVQDIADLVHILRLKLSKGNPKVNLNTSRIIKSIGAIGRINETRVIGWGKYTHSDEAANAELYINDKLVQTKLAKDFRQHLLDAKVHPTGHCGYLFDLKDSPLKNGDKVAVKLADDIDFLKNSNQIFKKKLKRCIVHIGLHKTGSSSIQSTLSNIPTSQDFLYLNLGIANHSIPIYSLFTEYPEHYYIHKRKGLNEENVIKYNKDMMNKLTNSIESSTAENIIISGEDISRLSKPALKKFKSFLQTFFNKIEIIAYIRDPYSFLGSSFQERVKGGSNSFDFDKGYPHYRARIQKFDDLFGQKNVFLYHFDKEKLYKKDVVLDFCHHIGIKINSNNIKRSNESISRETLSLLYIYYKFGNGYGVGPNVVKENNLLIKELSKLGNTKLSFSPKLIKPLLEKNLDDIEWIESRMGISFDKNNAESKNDVYCENDLFQIDTSIIMALRNLIGENNIPKGMKSNTSEEIAKLVHILRMKLVKSTLKKR